MKRCLWLAVATISLTANAQQPPSFDVESAAKGSWFRDPVSEMVFFAVLEGLYEDGVSTEVVDLIIPPDPKTGEPIFGEHFIYTCPLCHPAFEAFRLYRAREPFYGQKVAKVDAFGPGLDSTFVERLRGAKKSDRLDAIQELITAWVARRLDSMRLTPVERQEWERQLQAKRDQGFRALKGFLADEHGGYFAQRYADWKKCAICEGSLGACKRPR